MPRNVMSRALYNVAQNTATPISVTNVAISDPKGVRPRQSRHTVIDHGIHLEISVQIFRDELGLTCSFTISTKKKKPITHSRLTRTFFNINSFYKLFSF